MPILVQALLALSLVLSLACSTAPERPPNVVVIFIDDMGYADIGPFGADYPTPHLDQMAREGRTFTDFEVSSPVCSASRAALLTGAIHRRVDVSGAYGPHSVEGLNPDETTIAELAREKGYATACYGKWHLGLHPKFLPTNQGFDEYFGIPYSNDMWPLHPDYFLHGYETAARKRNYPSLPMLENETVSNPALTGEDQALLTRRYTERAVDFIDRNRDDPFFLYVPHSMVHVPLFASDDFLGKSGAGLFADVVMELDWSVGEILGALRRNGIAEDTLVVFTSDNGPWLSYGNHAGSSGPFREGKGTTFEGGQRVPTIFWWPGRIPAGTTTDLLASTIDILPTVAALIGAELPDVALDGRDIQPLLFDESDVESPHDYFPYYYQRSLHAVRTERWKLVLPHMYRSLVGGPGGVDGTPTEYQQVPAELALYDLDQDEGETTNVKEQHPEVFDELMAVAERYRQELGDRLTETEGSAVRPAGRMEEGDERLRWW